MGRQLQNPIIYILLFALAFDVAIWVLEGAHGWPFESIAILVILAFNTIMGVWQEYRAEDALARLKELAAPRVWVRRDGSLTEIPAADLVPGDVVRVEAGDRIPADGDLTGEQGLMVDESMLTGESVPVDRAVGDEVFSGTLAVRGLAWLVVTRTGPDVGDGPYRRHALGCRGRSDAARASPHPVRSPDRTLGGGPRGGADGRRRRRRRHRPNRRGPVVRCGGRRGGRPRRSPGGADADVGARHRTHGVASGSRSPAFGRGGAGVGHGGRHRQDRNPHREHDDGAGGRCRRRAAGAAGDGVGRRGGARRRLGRSARGRALRPRRPSRGGRRGASEPATSGSRSARSTRSGSTCGSRCSMPAGRCPT